MTETKSTPAEQQTTDASPFVMPASLLAAARAGSLVVMAGAAGRSPWRIYVVLEQAKSLLDLRQADAAVRALTDLQQPIEKYPLWSSWEDEVWGQFHLATGRPDQARAAFSAAIAKAETMELSWRQNLLRQYLPMCVPVG